MTAARGYGLAGGTTNTTLSFTVHFFDALNNNYTGLGDNISVWVSDWDDDVLNLSLFSLVPMVEDNGDGLYTISYGVLVLGNFYLHVAVNGAEIGQSPFFVEFSSKTLSLPCGENGCSSHGLCYLDGHCICDTGFTADDCSIGTYLDVRMTN